MLILQPTKLVTFILSFILFLNFSTTALASEHTLITKQELKSAGFSEYESINPNLLVFPIKRITETVKLSLTFNKESKIRYQYTLIDRRFKELVFIINFQKTGFLEETVVRYNTLLGKMILNYDLNKNYKDQAPKDKLSTYINVLKTLQDRYNSESAYRLLIQQAIDSTRRLI